MPSDATLFGAIALPSGRSTAGVNLQEWLYLELREAMLAGRLAAGSKLPGSRTLAARLGVARGTVQAAYQQLLSEGYAVSRTGSGTRVCLELPDAKQRVFPRQRGGGAQIPVRRVPPSTEWVERLQTATPAFARRKVA